MYRRTVNRILIRILRYKSYLNHSIACSLFFALRGGRYGPVKRKNKVIPCELKSMWFVLRWISQEREARGRTSHLVASYARSSFSSHPMLHYGKVCPCILRRDILPSNSAGASSSPLRPCAVPSPRALRTRSRPHLPRNRPPRPTRPPIAPFPIIPIDTSSTWVCSWCFVGVVLTGAAPRQSHVRLLRISR